MSVALRKAMSREEFFRWAEVQDARYEFDGFQPVAMTGGNLGHSTVTGTIIQQLRNRLSGKPYRPLGPDAGVATSGNTVRYPDAVVTCTAFNQDGHLVPDPVIVFEVVSPSSIRMDRIIKLREYQSIPTIRRYIIVESAAVAVTVHFRNHDGALFQTEALAGKRRVATPGDRYRNPRSVDL